MGAVFEAVNESVGGRAAIKVLHKEAATKHDIAARFFSEARAANAVEHPSIIHVFDCGYTSDGIAYLAMEYLSGETLAHRLTKTGCLPIAAAVRFTRQAASALAFVHARGLVHRDLKPENLMIVSDPEAPGGERIKILDFGIARLAQDLRNSRINTRTGMILGTPLYMAPEQCHGAKLVTELADVYSLGVILYQMLAGRPPFVAEGVGEILAMHLKEPPVPISQIAPDVTPELASLVHAMLAKASAERPVMRQVEAILRVLTRRVASAHDEASADSIDAITRQVKAVDIRPRLELDREPSAKPALDAPGAQLAVRPPPSAPRAPTVKQGDGLGGGVLIRPSRSLALVGELRSALLSTRGLVAGALLVTVVSVLIGRRLVASGTAANPSIAAASSITRSREQTDKKPSSEAPDPSRASASGTAASPARSDRAPSADSKTSDRASPAPGVAVSLPSAQTEVPGVTSRRKQGSPSAPLTEAEIQLRQAEQDFAATRYDEAASKALQALPQAPNHAWILLGKIGCIRRNPAEAQNALDQLLSLNDEKGVEAIVKKCRDYQLLRNVYGQFKFVVTPAASPPVNVGDLRDPFTSASSPSARQAPKELSNPFSKQSLDKQYTDTERELFVGNYQSAAQHASELLGSPYYQDRGWAIIGKSACALGDLPKADQAMQRLGSYPSQLGILLQFCRSKKVTLGPNRKFRRER